MHHLMPVHFDKARTSSETLDLPTKIKDKFLSIGEIVESILQKQTHLWKNNC